MKELLTRKNISRASWAVAGGFTLSSIIEGLTDQEWGMGNELGILLAVIAAVLTGGQKPRFHSGKKKD